MYASPLFNRGSTDSNNGSFLHSSPMNDSVFGNAGSGDSATTAPSLFGNKKRRSAVSGPNFMNSPAAGPTAPASDIFSSPAPPSAIPSSIRDNVTASGKTVHWSPSLVQEENLNSSRLMRPSLARNPPPSGYSSQIPSGPPLRSLRSEIETVPKKSRRSVGGATAVPSLSESIFSKDSTLSSPPADTVADTWVTVFGFPPEQSANILKYFSRHGEVVRHEIPAKGNWMHIRYSCAIHARQAISRNATILDGCMRIGVMPCTEKELIGNDVPNVSVLGRSIIEEPIMEEAEETIPALSNIDQNCSVLDTSSLNSSRLSMSARTGMRSLSAGYNKNSTEEQPTKQDSIMNKLWSAVGF